MTAAARHPAARHPRSALALAQSGAVADALCAAPVTRRAGRGRHRRATGPRRARPQIGGTGVFVTALRERCWPARSTSRCTRSRTCRPRRRRGLVARRRPGTRGPARRARRPRRADPRRAAAPASRVGTGSPRRTAQLRALGLGLEVVADPRQRRHPARQGGRRASSTRSCWPAAGLARLGRLDEVDRGARPAADAAGARPGRAGGRVPRRRPRAGRDRSALLDDPHDPGRGRSPSARCSPRSRPAAPLRSARSPRSPRATTGSRSTCAASSSASTAAQTSGCPRPVRYDDAEASAPPGRRPARRGCRRPDGKSHMTTTPQDSPSTQEDRARHRHPRRGRPRRPRPAHRARGRGARRGRRGVRRRDPPRCRARPYRRAASRSSTPRRSTTRPSWPRRSSPRARAGSNVVRLFPGDPFVGCGGPALADALGKAKVGFELVAGRQRGDRRAGLRRHAADRRAPTTASHRRRRRHAEPDWAALRRPPSTSWCSASTPRTPARLARARRRTAARRSPRSRDRRRHDDRAAHRRLHPRQRRVGVATADHVAGPAVRRRRRRGQAARQAVLVGDPAAVRLEGAGAAHQGAGRRAVGAAALATAPSPSRCRRSPSSRRGRRRRRAGDQGPGPGPLPVGRLHLGQRREGGPREASRSSASTRARSPASRSPASARRPPRRSCGCGIRPDLVPGGEQSSEGLLADLAGVRRRPRPARPGAAAARRHRDRDARRRA